MTDLECLDCGLTATFADAAILDAHKSCDVPETRGPSGTQHTWEER